MLEPLSTRPEPRHSPIADFGGELLSPAHPDFERSRKLWNGMIDKTPALIARCASTADVQAAVRYARTRGLTLAVRGGGHNVAGLASVDDGLVIDLSALNAVRVDAKQRVARVGGGAKIGEMDRATQSFGLAAPSGVVSATGVAGLTLGGGMGWLRRAYGLACDNLVGADVVLADGRSVRATKAENADLLWGLRGGGGNFGVVTELVFRLHPIGPQVAFTFACYPLQEADRVLRAHEAFLRRDEAGRVSTLAVLGRIPHAEPFPEALFGAPFVGILGMYAGEVGAGMTFMQPLREITAALIDLSGPLPYTEAQRIYDADYPDGGRYYWKSTKLMALSGEVLELLVAWAERAPSDHSTIDIWYGGGALARRSADATAFGRRDVPYLVNLEANWQREADDEANIAWARGCLGALEAHSAGGSYLNFPGFQEEGDAQTKAAYGANYRRLARLKAKYDPENVFQMNANIKPEEAL